MQTQSPVLLSFVSALIPSSSGRSGLSALFLEKVRCERFQLSKPSYSPQRLQRESRGGPVSE